MIEELVNEIRYMIIAWCAGAASMGIYLMVRDWWRSR